MILLDYPNKDNNYQEVLKSRGINYIVQKEIILDINQCDIAAIIEEDHYDKYILKNTNYFYIKDKEINKIINKLIN